MHRVDIREITASDTYPLRSQVLRPGRPIEECHFAEDLNPEALHLGAFNEDSLVCVASFYPEALSGVESEMPYRLRGMATHPDHRKHGHGLALLERGMDILRERGSHFLWCNARSNVTAFYEQAGFEVRGEEFEIPDIGPHKIMLRSL